MIAAVIGLLLPVAAVWLSLLALRLRQPRDSRALTAAVAFGGGIGLSSVSTFWFMAQWGLTGAWFVAADACLWTAVGAAAWWHLRCTESNGLWLPSAHASPGPSPLTTADWLVRIAFCVVATVALATTVTEYITSPHGQWDAWAIWNQKARFLLRGDDQWTASLGVSWSNPSHPLLVSASVARLWSYAGAELTAVPAMLGLGFGIAIVGAVMGALDPGRTRAWIGGAVLLAPGTFVQQIAAQTADLPTGFFVVATLIMLRKERPASWLDPEEARGSLLLAGMLGGLAAWTKNEGLLLLGLTALLAAWTTLRHGRVRQMAWWAAGTVPALATIAWLKIAISQVPAGYFSEADTTATIVARLFAPERHAMVSTLVWQYWIRWGGSRAVGVLPLMMAAAAIVALTHRGRSVRGAALTISVMLGGYYAVWVLSPLDTVWLVSTTFDRLIVQLWPSLVLTAFSSGERAR